MPSYYPLLTRQNAWAFNQPLSFDTSMVTTMEAMVAVRSGHARVLNLQSGSPHACVAWVAFPFPPVCQPAPLAPHRVCPPITLQLTRQDAEAYNQPLSLDTSKVTTMEKMLEVRSARAWNPSL